jgi:hypothetical protein
VSCRNTTRSPADRGEPFVPVAASIDEVPSTFRAKRALCPR